MAAFRRSIEILPLMFLVFTLNTVSCEVKVEAFSGDSVLLSCTVSEDDTLRKNASVYWMDKDDNVVLEIAGNTPKLSSQSKKYSNRIVSFPKAYKTGNFSILMKSVRPSDGGPYDCVIPSVDFRQRLVLTVSGERVEAAATRSPGPSGVATATTNSLHLILLSLLLCLSSSC